MTAGEWVIEYVTQMPSGSEEWMRVRNFELELVVHPRTLQSARAFDAMTPTSLQNTIRWATALTNQNSRLARAKLVICSSFRLRNVKTDETIPVGIL